MRTLEQCEEQMLMSRFIQESNAIEDIITPLDDVWRQHNTRIIKGHLGALYDAEIDAAVDKEILNKKMICDWHTLILKEQNTMPNQIHFPEKYIGEYRDVGVMVGNERKCPPHLIDARMEDLLGRIRTRSIMAGVLMLAAMHPQSLPTLHIQNRCSGPTTGATMESTRRCRASSRSNTLRLA